MPGRMPELGFYTLAGAPRTPRELLDEVRQGEEMGFGSVFISERFNVKEAATLCGAASAVTSEINIATAATNHNTRHPMVTASFAMTMHRLTDGRFTLGLGRGIAPLMRLFGLQVATTAEIEDFAGLMWRLWRGEVVAGHNGPAGSFPLLTLGSEFNERIPMLLTAFGPKSLALAGRAFDAVVLHTYFTDETTERCVRAVRTAAEQSGRDPADVRIWSCFATVGDHLPVEARLRKTVGRLATYLQVYGDLLVRTNGWDSAVLQRFRDDDVVKSFRGAIDAAASDAQLEHIATLIPDEWLAPAATGTPEQCARAINGQLALGCDGVILHGASPAELEPVVEEYRRTRPPERTRDTAESGSR